MGQRVVVIGAGGHAAVVIDAMRAGGEVEPVACVDDNESIHGSRLLDVPILGAINTLPKLADGLAKGFVLGVGGADDLSIRTDLWGRAISAGLEPVSVLHPTSVVSTSQIKSGLFVAAGAIIGVRASIGDNAIVNSGAIVEHDCCVGDHAHVAPGAMLAGGVTVGKAALIGMGATVRQGVSIGDGAIVGMGAVVTRDVAAGAVVVGCPARAR